MDCFEIGLCINTTSIRDVYAEKSLDTDTEIVPTL